MTRLSSDASTSSATSVAYLVGIDVSKARLDLARTDRRDVLTVKGLPGCGAGSRCDAVARGRWSRWGAVPVSGLGLAVYAILSAAALGVHLCSEGAIQSLAAATLLTTSFIAVGSIVWFVALQALVIRRFCGYCMLVHACGLVVAAIVFAHSGVWLAGAFQAPIAIALIALAVLIVGQIVLKPKMYAMIPAGPAPRPTAATQVIAPAREASAASGTNCWSASNRELTLFNGRINVNLDHWPLIGPSDAEHVIVWLFDFTCRECHHLHQLLRSAVQNSNGQLAVAAVPIPQHPACNSTMMCHKLERAQACQYARLSLALWISSPHQYMQWDEFMAREDECQPFGLALGKAKELADLSGYELCEPDKVLDRRLESAIAIFVAANSPRIPCLVLPTGVLAGHIPDVGSLVDLLKKYGSLTIAAPTAADTIPRS